MPTTKICTHCGAVYGVDQRFCPTDGSPLRLESTDDPLIGRVIADRYQILGLLGEGGMGRVYAAEHVRMGRKSAVKVMSPGMAFSAEAISRFNREAANASRINHPNVAAIYDFGEADDGMLYLAMEFVDGETLTTIIQRDGHLSIARAAGITKQAADALHAAHHLGIVHRDLKPDNIMVARHLDGTDWVKVVDFGIAKTAGGDSSQTVTTAGVSLGTPEYMSPEQLAGEKLDNRTDIYSLGLVLFNMLTGDLPYPRVTSRETLVRRLTSAPRSLAEVRPTTVWPARLQATLDRALASHVADRYANVGEFGRDVLAAASVTLVDPDRTVRVVSTTAKLAAHLAGERARPRWAVPLIAAALVLAGTTAVALARGREARGAPARHAAIVVRHDSVVPSVAVAPPPLRIEAPAVDTAARRVVNASSAPAVPRVVKKTRSTAVPSAHRIAVAQAKPAAPEKARPDAAVRNPTAAFEAGPKHPWLRASGDSGVPTPLGPNATPADRVRAAVADIQGHLERGTRLESNRKFGQARAEYHDAADEARALRMLFAAGPVAQQLGMLMRQAQQNGLRACQSAQADTMNPNAWAIRCGPQQNRNVRQTPPATP
jgi:hypothetical protein